MIQIYWGEPVTGDLVLNLCSEGGNIYDEQRTAIRDSLFRDYKLHYSKSHQITFKVQATDKDYLVSWGVTLLRVQVNKN